MVSVVHLLTISNISNEESRDYDRSIAKNCSTAERVEPMKWLD